MKTKNSFNKFVLLCLFITFFIFLMPLLSFAAQPGIHVDEWNTFTWTSNAASPSYALDHYVRVIDYDGIAVDGSSHTVTVTYPDSSNHALSFVSRIDAHSAYYELWDPSIPQPPGTAYTGNYVYRVTDLATTEWSEMTDNVQVDIILPPDETTFSPTLDPPQSIVAYFDDVIVNGTPYDDFTSGFNPSNWQSQPSEVTFVAGEARFEQINSLGRGPIRLSFTDPSGKNTIKTTVRVTSADDIARARIAGFFCRNTQGDVYADVRIQGGQARYFVGEFWWEGDHFIQNSLALTNLGPVTLGNNYELTLDWDEPSKTFTFTVLGLDDSVNYSDTYTVSGSITPPNESLKGIEVVAWNNLDTTTPTFDWDTVTGANHYRVRIYGRNDHKIYTGYTKSPPYTLPPGILKPHGLYKYRIYAQKENQWFEADNVSASDRNKTMFWAGPDEAQDPFVDLHSIGVGTWTSDTPVGTRTYFHIKVHDAQGVHGNIESVKVLLPDLTEVNLYLDYNDSDTCAHYRGDYFGTIQSGEYAFTVVDKDGNSHSRAETLTPSPIDPPSEASLLPANNTVVGDTGVSFDWNDVSGAAFYQLSLYDKDLNYLFQVNTTESEYTLPPGLLKENSQYRYRVRSRREFFEDNADNGSSVPPYTWNANTFYTTATNGTETPTLNLDSFGVAVWQGPHPATGVPVYELDFFAMVTDSDGVPENIERVEVTYPDGTTTRLLKYVDNPDWGSNYLAIEYYANLSSIQDTTNSSGIYTFKVVDFDGNDFTLTDTLTNVTSNVLPWPTNLSPADDTVLSNTTPIITWDSVSGASYYKVRILRSWGGSTVHWSSELTQTQYMVPGGVLEPDTIYSYRVYAYREASGSEVDFFSGSNYFHSTNNHFTTGDTGDDELAVDFDGNGLWHYSGITWTHLAAWDPDGLVEWDGGLAANFGATNGLWNYDGTTWTQLAAWESEDGIAWNNDLAVDFGPNGLWSYDGTTWTNLAAWDPDDGMVEWTGGLAVDFGVSHGLYNYAGSTWTQLAAWDPEDDMIRWTDGLAVDFGIHGLWSYDGTTWTHLAAWNPDRMVEWSGGLAVDFDTHGLWNYDGTTWTHLAAWDPEDGMVSWSDGLAVDFGAVNGLWSYDGTTWTHLAAWNPEDDMISWNDGLAVDFGVAHGLWNYEGSTWTHLAAWDPEEIIDVDLF